MRLHDLCGSCMQRTVMTSSLVAIIASVEQIIDS